MFEHHVTARIQLTPMSQVTEAVDIEDDWTGLTDAASRRKRQNRLNVRAYRRRRKALELSKHPAYTATPEPSVSKTETGTVYWVEVRQSVSVFPGSVVNPFSKETPLIPSQSVITNTDKFGRPPEKRIIFPLSSDHLITLLQFNVLRGCITNRHLLSSIQPVIQGDCATAALHVLPYPSLPQTVPSTLMPTILQLTVPHEAWIDIIPHPVWRDNLILSSGTYDEDELWSDTIGGLFDGFPACEVEQRGVVAWSPPWHVSGWEISEGFWRKWGWSFTGCGDILEATNRWRRERGEEPLIFEV